MLAKFNHSAPALRRVADQFLAVLLLGFTGLSVGAQSVPMYSGRPFIQIVRANITDPAAGRISGFGRAQVIGDGVVFVTVNGTEPTGLYQGRGGPLTRLAGPGSVTPSGPLQVFHAGFARGTAGGAGVAIAAGNPKADAIYRADGAVFTPLLTPGSILPNSSNRPANVVGEPFLVGDKLAVIAAHRPDGGTDDFRGVYRVTGGSLVAIADTATALPGLGVPDGFSSQVGFDGTSVAFWATRGPFTETEGIFVHGGSNVVRNLARTGDPFPGGGTMDGFISPPFVDDGVVYFYANDSARVTRLLKFENGTTTVVAKDGDSTPEGDALQSLGQFGLAVEAGRVFFPALTPRGPGLYTVEAGVLKTVVTPGVTLAGLKPAAIVLQDVAGDTIAIEVSDTFGNRRLAANLNSPAVPVILSSPTNRTVAPGARVELKVVAIGDSPLSYSWSGPFGIIPGATTDTLIIETAGATNVGSYRVTVSNPLGSVFSDAALLNVEVKPEILADLTHSAVEVGDSLQLRVTALGGLPLSYTWFKDGVPATNQTTAAGLFLRLASSVTDAGRYTVVVSNAWGQVSSAEAVVTINPSAPNPVFGGGRFVKIVDATTLIPDSGTLFAPQTLGEFSARFLGDEIVFVGGSTDQPQGGVFRWKLGSLTRVLGAGATLPNGLGTAEAFSLVPAPASEPLSVAGLKTVNGFLQPVGLYRAEGAGLAVLADTTLSVPGTSGATFPIFFGGSAQAGGGTLFSATLSNRPALYRADAAGLSRVLSAQQDLPVVGTATTQLQSLSYDGQRANIVAATANQQTLVMLQVDAAGGIRKLLATGDPLPGTSDTVRSFGPSDTENGVTHFIAFNSSFAVHIVEWREGVLTRVAGPGMAVAGLGTIQSLETSFPKASGGRAFFAARLSTPGGVRRGIVAAGPSGIEPVFMNSKLDARSVASSYVVASDGNRVLVLVDFLAGDRALYANVGSVGGNELSLKYTRPSLGTIRFTVPQGAKLEASGALGGDWQPVVGGGAAEVEVGTGSGFRFYRLRGE